MEAIAIAVVATFIEVIVIMKVVAIDVSSKE